MEISSLASSWKMSFLDHRIIERKLINERLLQQEVSEMDLDSTGHGEEFKLTINVSDFDEVSMLKNFIDRLCYNFDNSDEEFESDYYDEDSDDCNDEFDSQDLMERAVMALSKLRLDANNIKSLWDDFSSKCIDDTHALTLFKFFSQLSDVGTFHIFNKKATEGSEKFVKFGTNLSPSIWSDCEPTPVTSHFFCTSTKSAYAESLYGDIKILEDGHVALQLKS